LRKLVETYLSEFSETSKAVAVADIEKVAAVLYQAWLGEKQVFTFGNGGSASTASHFASDLSKLGVKAYCLNDNQARVTAITNDSGFGKLYVEQLESRFNGGDIVVGFSVHGGIGEDRAGKWSQNLLLAIDYAKVHNGKSIGIVGFEGGIMRKICDASIKVNVLSTPIVESWHLGLAHLLCECLKAKQGLSYEIKPVKSCCKCHRIQDFENTVCLSCGHPEFDIVAGVIGNIEDVKKRDNFKGTD